jgi:energy-coupling factor transporter ATP-binding protein EcfA2
VGESRSQYVHHSLGTVAMLVLARRPTLLVLDEPLAMLEPLARFDFMDTVMTAAPQDGLSVWLLLVSMLLATATVWLIRHRAT